jgi:hypothetical protein
VCLLREDTMRFSLRSLLLCTALIAVICAAFVLPMGWPVLAVPALSIILLSAAASGAVYAGGARRAFCIGYTVAGCWIVLYTVMFPFLAIIDGPRGFERLLEQLNDPANYQPLWGWRVIFAAYLIVNVLGGLTAVLVRWMCVQPNRLSTERASQSDDELATKTPPVG